MTSLYLISSGQTQQALCIRCKRWWQKRGHIPHLIHVPDQMDYNQKVQLLNDLLYEIQIDQKEKSGSAYIAWYRFAGNII